MSLRDFQIISKLGEGAYSSVYKVKRLTDNQEYALKKVKLLNLSDKEKQNALNEVRILASVRHPSMISYKEAFLEESSNSLCIVMEYCNNGDLFQKIVEHQKKGTLFPEVEIWNIFIQMIKGLKALHDMKIFHRDLKSANIFLNKDGTVKLGDLNVSKVAKKGLLYTQTGTPYYASPEVWRDQPYDSKSDIWSLGCVLYEMTTLKPPFRAEDMEGLYKKVLRGYYPRIPSHYSQDLNNIIRCLLQVSPQLRPSCDKLLQMPALIKRMDDRHLMEADDPAQNNLLMTIRIPKNLHVLTERLPKPNYAPMKIKRIDKHKFLQTLAGYKDLSPNTSGIDELSFKGSESVDSHKKHFKEPKNNGNIHLPPLQAYGGNLTKEKEDILKAYAVQDLKPREKPKIALNKYSLNDPSEKNLLLIEQINKINQLKNIDKELEISRDRNKDRESNNASPLPQLVPGYSAHNINKDLPYNKHLVNLKNIYGGGNGTNSNRRLHIELSPIKGNHIVIADGLPAIIGHKKNRSSDEHKEVEEDSIREPIIEKTNKLQPIDSKGNLPQIKKGSKENSDNLSSGSPVSINKAKVKEAKIVSDKVNELNERYQAAGSQGNHQRDKSKENYMVKNQNILNTGNYLEIGTQEIKNSKEISIVDQQSKEQLS